MDKYANMEVSYAKQVLRRFRGRTPSELTRPNLLLLIQAMQVILANYNPKELQFK